jgi:hypothetical protein
MPIPLIAIPVYGVLANVCYLLGPAAEITLLGVWGRSLLPPGPALFRMGLTFSVGLTLLPVILAMIGYLVRLTSWIL